MATTEEILEGIKDNKTIIITLGIILIIAQFLGIPKQTLNTIITISIILTIITTLGNIQEQKKEMKQIEVDIFTHKALRERRRINKYYGTTIPEGTIKTTGIHPIKSTTGRINFWKVGIVIEGERGKKDYYLIRVDDKNKTLRGITKIRKPYEGEEKDTLIIDNEDVTQEEIEQVKKLIKPEQKTIGWTTKMHWIEKINEELKLNQKITIKYPTNLNNIANQIIDFYNKNSTIIPTTKKTIKETRPDEYCPQGHKLKKEKPWIRTQILNHPKNPKKNIAKKIICCPECEWKETYEEILYSYELELIAALKQ